MQKIIKRQKLSITLSFIISYEERRQEMITVEYQWYGSATNRELTQCLILRPNRYELIRVDMRCANKCS